MHLLHCIILFKMNKNSTLSLQFHKLISSALKPQTTYSLIIRLPQQPSTTQKCPPAQRSELTLTSHLIINIPNSLIKRDSKCTIEVQEGDKASTLFGKIQFGIMDYRNYSRSSFLLTDCKDAKATLHMNINISSHAPPSSQPNRHPKKVTLQLPLQTNKEIHESTSINKIIENFHSPTPEIRLICPSECTSQKEPKSMFSAFEQSGIEVSSKKDNAEKSSKKGRKHSPLSSLGEIFEKKEELKIPSEKENLALSCRLALSRGIHDSRYCKEIQENLNNLSALDDDGSKLSLSRSPLKGEEQEPTIFDTLNRMKAKFEKIHEKEAILNHEPYLDMLLEENEERQSCPELQISAHNEYSIEQTPIPRVLPPQTHRKLPEPISSVIIGSSLTINTTVKIIIQPNKQRKQLKTVRTCNLKLKIEPSQQIQEDEQLNDPLSTKRKYHSRAGSQSSEAIDKKQEIDNKNYSLTATYQNSLVEQQSLKRVAYVKLNKMNHLSKTADIFKRKNTFLIQANEQMMMAQKRLDQKLQISRTLISQKEDMLNHEFDTLRDHLRRITLKLSQTNQQSQRRQAKIATLQGQLEISVRENNQLKEQIKEKTKNIQDLRHMLTVNELTSKGFIEHEETPPQKDPPKTDRSLKEKSQTKICQNGLFSATKRTNSASKTVILEDFARNRKFSTPDGLDPNSKSTEMGTRRFSHSKNVSFSISEVRKPLQDGPLYDGKQQWFLDKLANFLKSEDTRLLR